MIVRDVDNDRCPCLPRSGARPYEPFVSKGGLQAVISELNALTAHVPPPTTTAPATTTVESPPSSPSSSTAATPTIVPDITNAVTCYGPHGSNYLADLNKKWPVTALCGGGTSDLTKGGFQQAACPPGTPWPDWCNNIELIFFTMASDAPSICTTPSPDRDIFCTTPFNSILEACKLSLK